LKTIDKTRAKMDDDENEEVIGHQEDSDFHGEMSQF
jgi:hypothetical protein